MNNELKHYGVPGMKWGVTNRRTSSGHYRQTSTMRDSDWDKVKNAASKFKSGSSQKNSISVSEKPKVEVSSPAKQRKSISSAKLNATSQLIGTGVGLASRGSKSVDDIVKNRGKTESIKNVKQIPTSELKEKVKRMNLEKQYVDLSPVKVSKGAAITKGILDGVVYAGGLAVSGLTIATLIKQLRGK